jgi:predicted RNA-binding Zn ribbon-like protein
VSGDWLWDGGRPAVDLVNTLRDRKTAARETLHTPADLEEWLASAGLAEPPARATEQDLATAWALREAIDAVAFAVLQGRRVPVEAVETINAVASAVPVVPLLGIDADGRPMAVRDPATAVAAGLAAIAVDAIGLLVDGAGELARLRVCAADDCGVRFIDRSPARNRQWCSMRRCGNRTKARRHYARRRR